MKRVILSRIRVLLTAATLLASLATSASTLQGDALLLIPKALIRNLGSSVAGSYHHALPSLTIPGEFPAETTNIQTDFNYKVTNFDPQSNGNFDVTVNLSDFKIAMDTFHIDQTVERVQNGVVIRIRVLVDCQNMVITARHPFDVTGVGKIQNPLGLIAQSLNTPADQSLWAVTAASCQQGPQDATQFVETQLNQAFANSQDIRNYVLSELNIKLADFSNSTNRTFTQTFPLFNTTLTVTAQDFIDNADAWVIRMPVTGTSDKDCPSINKLGTLPPTTLGVVTGDIQIQTSEKLVSAFAKCAQEVGAFNRADNTSQIQAFKDLMSSALAKSVVWPDLNRFPANSTFNLYTTVPGAFTVAPMTAAPPAATAGSLYYSLNANILTKMRLVKGSVDEPYVQFFSPMKGVIEAHAQSNGFDVPSTLTFKWSGVPVINLDYMFNVPRNQVSNPNIDLTKIQPELLKILQTKSYGFSIDPFLLSPTQQVQLVGITRSGSNLQLNMGLVQRP